MKLFSSVLALGLGFSSPVLADMKASLMAPWGGPNIPAGQQCKLNGGNGSTPPIQVTGMPAGTVAVLVEYDDKSYQPLSTKGGHGTLIYPAKGASANLPSVPGMTDRLPGGVRVHKKSRGTGQYASKGYLPPCSGGRGNKYTATLYAIDGGGKKTAKTQITIGKY